MYLPHRSRRQATCITYSPDGNELCVGLASGYWFVFNSQHLTHACLFRPEREPKRNRHTGMAVLEDQGVACVGFCPHGRTLAVADYDQVRPPSADCRRSALRTPAPRRRPRGSIAHSFSRSRARSWLWCASRR